MMKKNLLLLLLQLTNIFSLKSNYPFLKNSYPFDPRIHSFGNTGIGGRIHAELAPYFTKMIDYCAYDNMDIRKATLMLQDNNKAILDLCCGVGFSTSSNDGSIGIDTSCEMINKAKKLHPDKTFLVEHAEFYNPQRSWEIATCFFGFHEMPKRAWINIINNCKKFTKEKIIIVDISPDYKASNAMLMGEPYLIEYQKEIQNSLSKLGFKEDYLIKNHVHIWTKKI